MNIRLAAFAGLAGAVVVSSAAFAQAGRTDREVGSIGNTRTPGRIGGWPNPWRTTSIREAQRMNPQVPTRDPRRPSFGMPDSRRPIQREGTLLPPPPRPDPRGPSNIPVTPGQGAFGFGGGTLIPPESIGPSLAPVVDPRHGAIVGAGSGLHVDGAFADENLRLKFHVGWPGVVVKHVNVCPPFHHHHNWWGWSPWADWYWESNRYVYIDSPYGVVDPTLAGYTPRPSVAQAPVSEAPATDRDVGDANLAAGFPKEAIAAYRAHLALYPDDAEVMRLLGLALVDAEEVKEGVAVLGLAYHKDLSLSEKPISAGVFGPRAGDLRRNVNRASAFAQSTGSSSAWLAMAVMVQAEGRTPVARKVLEKARAAGLDPAVADRMGKALR